MYVSSDPINPSLHSFPTRRTSDLGVAPVADHDLRPGRDDTPTGPRALRARLVPDSPAGVVPALPGRQEQDGRTVRPASARSEEHTSELQSRENLVCRLLLDKKKSS